MLEDKKVILSDNAFLQGRRQEKEASEFERRKSFFFVAAMFIAIGSIIALYFLLDVSNIYRIAVDGNIYLKDEDIIALSQLDNDDKFLLVFPYKTEKMIEEDPLIEECKVEKLNGSLVRIIVKEKKAIGYAVENGLNVLILADNERIPLNKDNIYLISSVPLISGFADDDIILLGKNLADCDHATINEISEIHSFPQLKYQNVELIMRDGNYIFTSPYGLKILNHYYDMESAYLSGLNKCYYFEDISGNAYTSACPWEETEEKNPEETEDEQDEEDELNAGDDELLSA